MAKYLVVVESPAKAKTINKFLGSNYIVKACFGAVRDLPKSTLGVDVDNNFEPKYVAIREETNRKALKEIKEHAAKVDHILIASDPDREGEAIAWHVAEILKNFKKTADKPTSRIVFNEITKENVKKAVKSPREVDFNLVDAQQARRVIDRLVGYKISPLLGWVVRKGLSAGRVQSVVTRMVIDRENEIRAFKPDEYWSMDALLKTPRDDTFIARLHSRNGDTVAVGKPGQIKSQEEADAVQAALKTAVFKVDTVKRKELKRRPAPPFITSTLQQDASRKLGMSTAQTMAIAQQLYQGINIGSEGQVGLITYMRTDSLRLSNEALDSARSYIKKEFGDEMLPEKPNFYKNKKNAQDAHEAIRPTSAFHTPDSLAEHLSEEQRKLYMLIWKRFIASQMPPAVLDQTTIDIPVNEFLFRATGSIMKFPGFTKLYKESTEDNNDPDDANRLLPEINEAEVMALNELKPEQHFTKPPPRYSEASLVRAMEENGIGRPSTYAPTIRTILGRMYVEKVSGRLVPTELGEEVNTWLTKNFPDILSIDFTARLEDNLDNVEEGTENWRKLTADFYVPFDKDLKETETRMVAELVGDDPRCPECGAEAILRQSWFGMFMGCTQEGCKGVIRINKTPPEPTDEICDKCDAPMVLRTGRYGKFIACSTYPKCDYVINLDKDGNKLPPKEPPVKTDKECPKCKKGMLLIRKSRKGEEFYGCEKFPKCRFTKPMELNLECAEEGCDGELDHTRIGRSRAIACSKCEFHGFGTVDKNTACEKCDNPWTLVKNKTKKKPKTITCPKSICGHVVEEIEELNESESGAEEAAAK